jgi:hypothetical protein
MTGEVVYRCDSCGSTFRVESETRPTVICPDCNVTATIRGDKESIAAYRLGYARYREGRRQLTAGLEQFDDEQWTHARALFDGASEAFETAVDQFRSATNRAQHASLDEFTETARRKAACYWRVADWLSGTAHARETDDRERVSHFRAEAQRELEKASELGAVREPEQLSADVGVDIPNSDGTEETDPEQAESGAEQSNATHEQAE